MKKSLRLLSLGLISLLSIGNLNAQMSDNLLFTAQLSGSQEVPAVATNGVGVGTFMLNNQRNELCITVSVANLSGPITAAHIHDGAVGVPGGVLVDLSAGISGNQIAVRLTSTELTSSLLEKLINGTTYINVHTTAHASGEIRGQILLEKDYGFVASATGAQEVPPVITSAYGLGVFTLSQDLSLMNYMFVAQGLSGTINTAHIHIGAVGVGGPAEEDITADISGNIIAGSFTPTPALLTALMNGSAYINAHTTANPNGEIRGQLVMESGLAFDARLSGDQEVPSVSTSAEGVAKFTLNSTLNSISYDIVTNGLSGAITMAHIHTGEFGVSGGALVDLSGGINGNRISGTISGATVTNALINSMLKGELYVNVHTAANPNGEIRGQIYRLAREGYTTLLTGAQEVPANVTDAYGSGFASINRDETDLHFGFVVGDLTSSTIAAHFHNAAVGVDGLPVFDISNYFSGLTTTDFAVGFLTSADVEPFTSTEADMFENSEMYINVHNVDYPSGEIRGQMNPGQVCYSLASLDDLTTEKFEVYPNPFTDLLMLSSEEMQTLAYITLFNMEGKEIVTLESPNTEQLYKINTSSLDAGMYLLKTTTKDGKSFHSQVVKR